MTSFDQCSEIMPEKRWRKQNQMKPQPLCLLCTFRTAYDVAKRSTDKEDLQARVLLEMAKWLVANYQTETATPATFHTQVCRVARLVTGNPDPFSKLKKFSNDQALKMLSSLEARIRACRDAKEAFQLAVRMAICGNTIDFEVENYGFSLEKFDSQFLNCLKKDLAIDHTILLMQQLGRSGKVAYILDNAGEIVFDKILIELIKGTYGCEIWAAVKEGPVLNDALMEDAEQVGITSSVPTITTGNDHIGVELSTSSEAFLHHFRTSDLVIAKGQGCYETLTEIEPMLSIPICYLLIAKCPVVAQDLGVPLNSGIVKLVNPEADSR